jgi:hypothetical protein
MNSTSETYKPYRVWLLERKHGKPIETLLADLLNECGTQTAVAKKLRVTQATVSGWIKRFGVTVKVEKVAVPPAVGVREVVEHASD